MYILYVLLEVAESTNKGLYHLCLSWVVFLCACMLLSPISFVRLVFERRILPDVSFFMFLQLPSGRPVLADSSALFSTTVPNMSIFSVG